NVKLRDMVTKELPLLSGPCEQGRQHDTTSMKAAWIDIIGRRQEHLELARRHFSLTLAEVEVSLDRWKPRPAKRSALIRPYVPESVRFPGYRSDLKITDLSCNTRETENEQELPRSLDIESVGRGFESRSPHSTTVESWISRTLRAEPLVSTMLEFVVLT